MLTQRYFDIDSIQFIKMVKDMRDEKKFQCGDKMTVEPCLFIGAAANPFADLFEFRVIRLAKKVAAGADFIQTQIVYNVDKFAGWLIEYNFNRPHQSPGYLATVEYIERELAKIRRPVLPMWSAST